MTSQIRSLVRRCGSLSLAAALTVAVTAPALAAEPIGDGVTPTYDEAYYATLDYYGNLTEGSVVKSYTLNGATEVFDHGTYDQVVNLTDGTAPTTKDDATVFRFDNAPKHFYFEGKTAAPFEALPWTISISYTLNGVPTKAEDLAGKTGVVEIKVDAVPNENASEYARHNYTLEAMSIFNQDDILSLDAPGGQVQLVGNLRAVMFLALPGEEQHFVIRVGTEDFAFDGMTFMMVPATFSQLEEIAKLAQRKDDLEENYNKLSGSLDTLLGSFADLSGSLRDTANGLDQLNQARETISAGKEQIYEDGDRVLDDLAKLNGSLDPLPGHLDDADDAVEDVTDAMSDVMDSTVDLQKNLDDVDDCLKDLQQDIRNIRDDTGSMQGNLTKLGDDLKKLQTSLTELKETLGLLNIQINGGILGDLPEKVQGHIKVQGQKLSDVLAQVQALETVWAGVAQGTETIGYQQFQVAAMLASKTAPSAEAAAALLAQIQQADAAIALVKAVQPSMTDAQALQYLVTAQKMTAEQAAAYSAAKPKLVVMETVYTAVCGGTDRTMTKADFYTAMLMLNDINSLPADQQTPENIGKVLAGKAVYAQTGKLLSGLNGDFDTVKLQGLLGNLADLLDHMGSEGLTGDLKDLLGKTDTTLGHLNGTAGVGRDILDRVDGLLDEIDDLDSTVNHHVPALRETLQDTRTLVEDMVVTVDHTHGFLSSFRSLAKTSGKELDDGTKQSLEGLAATLRKTARSMDATGDVKDAKGSIDEIIEDTWNEYTGGINNMLLMDANAEAESLTSSENPSPTSIQVLIRTQEIKIAEPTAEETAKQTADNGTFWSRVTQMFRDFWGAITGVFH